MTKQEKATQLAKYTALNSIASMYHPLYKGIKVDYWDEETYGEIRDRRIRNIIENLQTEIKQIKEKYGAVKLGQDKG